MTHHRRFKISYYTTVARRPEEKIVFYSDASTEDGAWVHLFLTEDRARVHYAVLTHVKPDDWIDD